MNKLRKFQDENEQTEAEAKLQGEKLYYKLKTG